MLGLKLFRWQSNRWRWLSSLSPVTLEVPLTHTHADHQHQLWLQWQQTAHLTRSTLSDRDIQRDTERREKEKERERNIIFSLFFFFLKTWPNTMKATLEVHGTNTWCGSRDENSKIGLVRRWERRNGIWLPIDLRLDVYCFVLEKPQKAGKRLYCHTLLPAGYFVYMYHMRCGKHHYICLRWSPFKMFPPWQSGVWFRGRGPTYQLPLTPLLSSDGGSQVFLWLLFTLTTLNPMSKMYNGYVNPPVCAAKVTLALFIHGWLVMSDHIHAGVQHSYYSLTFNWDLTFSYMCLLSED